MWLEPGPRGIIVGPSFLCPPPPTNTADFTRGENVSLLHSEILQDVSTRRYYVRYKNAFTASCIEIATQISPIKNKRDPHPSDQNWVSWRYGTIYIAEKCTSRRVWKMGGVGGGGGGGDCTECADVDVPRSRYFGNISAK